MEKKKMPRIRANRHRHKRPRRTPNVARVERLFARGTNNMLRWFIAGAMGLRWPVNDPADAARLTETLQQLEYDFRKFGYRQRFSVHAPSVTTHFRTYRDPQVSDAWYQYGELYQQERRSAFDTYSQHGTHWIGGPDVDPVTGPIGRVPRGSPELGSPAGEPS